MPFVATVLLTAARDEMKNLFDDVKGIPADKLALPLVGPKFELRNTS